MKKRFSINLVVLLCLTSVACNPFEIEIPHWDYDNLQEEELNSPVVYPVWNPENGPKPSSLKPESADLFTKTDIADGIVRYHFSGLDAASGVKQNVNVLEIDLDNESHNVKLYMAASDTLTGVAKKTGAVVATNGTFEQPSSYIRVAGVNKSEITIEPDNIRYWKHDAVLVGNGKRKMSILYGGDDRVKSIDLYKSLPERYIYSGAPLLIDDYELVGESAVPSHLTASYLNSLDTAHEWNFSYVRHPRTVAAVSTDNHLLLFAIDGRFSNKAEGMSAKEMTRFISKHFDARWALNLDGGGSTGMYIKGHGETAGHDIVNYPCDNGKWDHYGQRLHSSYIIVTAASKKQ